MSKQIPFDEDKYFQVNNDASASFFGYLFQAKVALWLFVSNIREISSVKVETKNQDVEISFEDGKKYYVQVKAQQSYSTPDNSRQKLKTAILSLSRTAVTEKNKLVYVNNFETPLLIDKSEQLRMNIEEYKNLSEDQRVVVDDCFKEIIDALKESAKKAKERKKKKSGLYEETIPEKKFKKLAKLVNDLDKNKLLFGNIYPCSEKEEDRLLFTVASKLSSLKIRLELTNVTNIFNDWSKMLTVSEFKKDNLENESKKTISKEVFSWSIASEILKSTFNYNDLMPYGILRDINSSSKQRVNKLINDGLFDNEDWTICNKVINEYVDYINENPEIHDNDFIELKWNDYVDDFSSKEETDMDVREAITRYKIYQIISKKNTIEEIQRKVGCRI